LLATLLSLLLAAPAASDIPVYAGAPIQLDGRVEDAEWADGFTVVRGDRPAGGKIRLRLKRNGPWLALALDGDGPYRGEMLRIFTTDENGAFVTNVILGLGQPTVPPALWRRRTPRGLADPDLGPGDCPRACLSRLDVTGTEHWSAEVLLRLGALGIGRGDLRDFRAFFLLTEYDPARQHVLSLPEGLTDPEKLENYGRLVSPDGWGAGETWAPVTPEQSREFDDNELLHRLFLEHERVSLRETPDQLVIANAVSPRSATRIAALRAELEAGRKRNPTLPAWTYYIGRLLNESNLYEEARAVIDSIPEPLRKFDAFASLLVDHYIDMQEFDAAEETCRKYPYMTACREKLALAARGKKVLEAERKAVAADAAKVDKNPRVLMKTSKGDMIIELFEDDAPNAVRNFMDLVIRHDYYDGIRFHAVQGGHVAWTGDPRTRLGSTTDQDGPDWRLRPDESKRGILRGYVAALPAAGGVFHGSQFLIALSPLLGEMERTFAFGRVVEGMDVLLSLEQDDTIEKIEVLSQRNHAYDPLAARLDR